MYLEGFCILQVIHHEALSTSCSRHLYGAGCRKHKTLCCWNTCMSCSLLPPFQGPSASSLSQMIGRCPSHKKMKAISVPQMTTQLYDRKPPAIDFTTTAANLASPELFQYAVLHYMPRVWIRQNKRDLKLARLEFQAVETLLQTWQHQFQLGSQLENYLCNMRTRTIHAAPWIMQFSMWPCNFTVIGSLSIVVHWSKNTILIYLAEVMCLYVHTIDLCHSVLQSYSFSVGKNTLV